MKRRSVMGPPNPPKGGIMLEFDADKGQENARRASTEDLLNRVTVYRAGMEPEALAIIEAELLRRGVRTCDIEDYERAARESVLEDASGVGLRCSFCSAPAVRERWGWHRLWGT